MEYNVPLKYNLIDFTHPAWEGDTILHESVMFREDAVTVALIHPADEIYSVYSSDLKTEYKKGIDWELIDGKIVRLENSAIPLVTFDMYYPEEKIEFRTFDCSEDGHDFIHFSEDDTIPKWQVVVTYRHSEKWNGPIPKNHADKLSRFYEKLKRGEEATLVFIGDSVTVGCNSSSFINTEPYLPCFAEMVTEAIAKKYGYAISWDIKPYRDNSDNVPMHGQRVLHYINTALGGTTSKWGIENAEQLMNAYSPDLAVIGFGSNDGGLAPEEFRSNMDQLTAKVRENDPELEIILLTQILPHKRVRGFYRNQYLFEDVLIKMADSDPHAVCIPITSVHQHLLTKKDYYHMTGNNVNHPNDFLCRVYASVFIKTII